MDEVDGMAGNEDRGGIQVLIHFILLTVSMYTSSQHVCIIGFDTLFVVL